MSRSVRQQTKRVSIGSKRSHIIVYCLSNVCPYLAHVVKFGSRTVQTSSTKHCACEVGGINCSDLPRTLFAVLRFSMTFNKEACRLMCMRNREASDFQLKMPQHDKPVYIRAANIINCAGPMSGSVAKMCGIGCDEPDINPVAKVKVRATYFKYPVLISQQTSS